MNIHEATATLLYLARMELTALIWGLAAIVGYQMLNGTIRLNGLFRDKTGIFSAPRVQMLMTNLIVASSYLSHPEQISVSSAPTAASLPVTPIGITALMGGSNLLYLVHKFAIHRSDRG